MKEKDKNKTWVVGDKNVTLKVKGLVTWRRI